MNIHYFISALIITLIIPILGMLIYLLNKFIYALLTKITSEKIAMVIVNWLTIPGVIHHEISHAFIAFMTGAVITEFKPFWPDRATGSLGHISFVARGPLFLRSLQYTLTSTAPVIMGTVTSIILFSLTKNTLPISTFFLLLYLIFSILIHASMSVADVKVMVKGIWVLYLGLLVFCTYIDLDLIRLFMTKIS